MTGQCTTINILSPANIISTSIDISPANCIEPCTIQVTVTWENIGDVQGDFVPGIIVDNTIMTLPLDTLINGQMASYNFTVTNLMKGSHTIYTSPSGVDPRTIEITESQSLQADRILIVGLYMGLASKAIEKWNKMRTEKIR